MQVSHHRVHNSLWRGLHELAGVMGEAGRLWRGLAVGGGRAFGLVAGRVLVDACAVAKTKGREHRGHGVLGEEVCVSRMAVDVYAIRGWGLWLSVRAVACGAVHGDAGGRRRGVDGHLASRGRVRAGLGWCVALGLGALAGVIPVIRCVVGFHGPWRGR